jgi:hypothetical protein
MKTSITVTTEIELTIEMAAKWFAELDDDSQAKFFVAVTEHAKSWPRHQDSQWWEVGRHLRNCECSTNEARDMIGTIHNAMQPNFSDCVTS